MTDFDFDDVADEIQKAANRIKEKTGADHVLWTSSQTTDEDVVWEDRDVEGKNIVIGGFRLIFENEEKPDEWNPLEEFVQNEQERDKHR